MARPLSVLRALLHADDAPSVTDVRSRLSNLDADGLDVECACAARGGQQRWCLEVQLDGMTLQVWLEPSPSVGSAFASAQVDDETAERARASDFCIVVATRFGDEPLWDYHRQLQVLSAVSERCVLVLDDNACALRTAQWLNEVASGTTPPSPQSLYSVHCIHDDEQRVWVHSHGLKRCGAIEFEMLDLPGEEAASMTPLVHAVAAMWIEDGPGECGEEFSVGKDLLLAWLPWQDALAKMKVRGPGGRADRDEVHATESGVLFVRTPSWKGPKYSCPSTLAPILDGNPMLYVSNMETVRMTLLAAERLHRFVSLLSQYGGDQQWRFLVKLGYQVDGGDDSQREHLWFDVHSIEGECADATLLNEPYHIARMHEGQRGTHALDKLSDWAILCPRGQFGPDSVCVAEESDETH